jgi:hypothetical protein
VAELLACGLQRILIVKEKTMTNSKASFLRVGGGRSTGPARGVAGVIFILFFAVSANAQISGTHSSQTGVENFTLNITNPASFSAVVTNNAQTDPGLDSMLFLFNSGGNGVFGNDDNGNASYPGGYNYQSNIIGNPGPAGTYTLSLTAFQYVPVDASGNHIFPLVETAPTAPNSGPAPGVGPVASYTLLANDGGNSLYFTGGYTIALTGATLVPEPAAFAVLSAGMFILFGRRRRAARLSLHA